MADDANSSEEFIAAYQWRGSRWTLQHKLSRNEAGTTDYLSIFAPGASSIDRLEALSQARLDRIAHLLSQQDGALPPPTSSSGAEKSVVVQKPFLEALNTEDCKEILNCISTASDSQGVLFDSITMARYFHRLADRFGVVSRELLDLVLEPENRFRGTGQWSFTPQAVANICGAVVKVFTGWSGTALGTKTWTAVRSDEQYNYQPFVRARARERRDKDALSEQDVLYVLHSALQHLARSLKRQKIDSALLEVFEKVGKTGLNDEIRKLTGMSHPRDMAGDLASVRNFCLAGVTLGKYKPQELSQVVHSIAKFVSSAGGAGGAVDLRNGQGSSSVRTGDDKLVLLVDTRRTFQKLLKPVLLETAERVLALGFKGFGSQELANLSWGLGKLDCLPPNFLLAVLKKAGGKNMNMFKVSELANIAWTAVSCGGAATPRSVASAEEEEDAGGEEELGEETETLLASDWLLVEPTTELLDKIIAMLMKSAASEDATSTISSAAAAIDLAQLVWCLGQTQTTQSLKSFRHLSFVRAAVAKMRQTLRAGPKSTITEAAMMLTGLQRLHFCDTRLLADVCDHVAHLRYTETASSCLNAGSVVSLVASLARFGAFHGDCVEVLLGRMVELWDEKKLSSEQKADLLWAVAALGVVYLRVVVGGAGAPAAPTDGLLVRGGQTLDGQRAEADQDLVVQLLRFAAQHLPSLENDEKLALARGAMLGQTYFAVHAALAKVSKTERIGRRSGATEKKRSSEKKSGLSNVPPLWLGAIKAQARWNRDRQNRSGHTHASIFENDVEKTLQSVVDAHNVAAENNRISISREATVEDFMTVDLLLSWTTSSGNEVNFVVEVDGTLHGNQELDPAAKAGSYHLTGSTLLRNQLFRIFGQPFYVVNFGTWSGLGERKTAFLGEMVRKKVEVLAGRDRAGTSRGGAAANREEQQATPVKKETTTAPVVEVVAPVVELVVEKSEAKQKKSKKRAAEVEVEAEPEAVKIKKEKKDKKAKKIAAEAPEEVPEKQNAVERPVEKAVEKPVEKALEKAAEKAEKKKKKRDREEDAEEPARDKKKKKKNK